MTAIKPSITRNSPLPNPSNPPPHIQRELPALTPHAPTTRPVRTPSCPPHKGMLMCVNVPCTTPADFVIVSMM